MEKIKAIIINISYVILFVICISVALFLSNRFIDNQIWGKLKLPYIQMINIKITATHFLHTAFGFPIFIYGLNLVHRTTLQNHKAQDKNTRKPLKLLTEGVYSTQRHPMYKGFICIQVGLWFGVHLLIGYAIGCFAIILISINSILEEKNELEKLFPIGYAEYKEAVPKRIYTKPLLCYLIVIGAMAIMSVITMG